MKEIENIPTAEEFLKQYHDDLILGKVVLYKTMVEFTKLHVKAALKNASERAAICINNRNVLYSEISSKDENLTVHKNSILNAYPLENIK